MKAHADFKKKKKKKEEEVRKSIGSLVINLQPNFLILLFIFTPTDELVYTVHVVII